MPHSATDRSAHNGFADNPLNRWSDKREDATFMAGMRGSHAARTLLFTADQTLLRDNGAGPDPLFAMEAAAGFGPVRETLFLGEGEGGPLFAALVEPGPDKTQAPPLLALDLRSLYARGNLPSALLGALGQARSALNWHMKHRFCSQCGAPTQAAASGWRRDCQACNAQNFPRTDPVVIMLAVNGDACLLGRQSRFPPGMYSCLAGFLEPGETIEDAVRRELFEEAGIRCGQVGYMSSQPWPFPNSLMIGCVAQSPSRALVLDQLELEDARWFTRAECAQIMAGAHPEGVTCPPKMAIAHRLMADWVG